MSAPVPSPPLANAPAGVPSLRTLGTTSVEAAPGNDGRFASPTNAQTAAAAGKIPLADGTGKISLAWLDLTGYVPTSTHVDAGSGLSGGGALTSSLTLSMPNVGPGSGTIGGSGTVIESVTLDAQGRVTAATTVFGGEAITTKTGTYAANTSDHTILGDTTGGAFTITLPTAVGRGGKIFIIKRISATGNNLTIDTTSSQTIDGATAVTLTSQYAGRVVQSDNANWHVIGTF
jgi:hypothetical protein